MGFCVAVIMELIPSGNKKNGGVIFFFRLLNDEKLKKK